MKKRSAALLAGLALATMGEQSMLAGIPEIDRPKPSRRICKTNSLSRKEWKKRKIRIRMQKDSRRTNR